MNYTQLHTTQASCRPPIPAAGDTSEAITPIHNHHATPNINPANRAQGDQ